MAIGQESVLSPEVLGLIKRGDFVTLTRMLRIESKYLVDIEVRWVEHVTTIGVIVTVLELINCIHFDVVFG